MEGYKEIKKIRKLFEPIQIGNMMLKNRAVLAPMVVGFAGINGEVTRDTIEYYVERAKAGMGLLTVEAVSVDPSQRGVGHQLFVYKNEFVAGFNCLARAIRIYVPDPPKISMQLIAWGRETEPEVCHGEVVAPSPLTSAIHPAFTDTKKAIANRRGVPRALTLSEIEEMEDSFAEAAMRAQLAEFDAVEFHAAHGYLIAQFLSPFTNKRDDIYGRDRRLFLTNIIKKTRQRVGPDFPIIVRFSGSEFVPGGATIEERQELARYLESLGVAAISVSGGVYETGYYIIPPMMIPNGCHLENASRIKEAVNIPVYAAGRINDPRMAEKALLDGKVDLVAFGRPFITDKEMLHKAKQGKFNEIRKCIACMHCHDHLFNQRRIECAVNPAVGDPLRGELAFEEASKRIASKSKKVIVVGGGPGGMQAAKVAKERGHHVTLFEKSSVLGGNMIPAAAVSFKEEINRFREYQINEMERLKIKCELGVELSSKDILGMKPDTVVLATGSFPIYPEIPGAKTHAKKVFMATDVLFGNTKLGKRAAVFGGGMIGCETAAWLAERGHEVTLISAQSVEFGLGKGLATEISGITRGWMFLVKWPTYGIKVVGLSQPIEIRAEGLVVINERYQYQTIPADSIVFSLGAKANDGLLNELQDKVPELHAIGDCKKPRRIANAVKEAAICAQSI
jgi:2,4-dienoyl-CoA reductase-like NADH-dependent reductase (Old Yellow Enzyme family)/thioredoxin reductase